MEALKLEEYVDLSVQSVTTTDAVADFFSGDIGRLRWNEIGKLGERLFRQVLSMLATIDLSVVSKDEWLRQVEVVFETMIAPAIHALGSWGLIIAPIAKVIVMGLASRFYDNQLAG